MAPSQRKRIRGWLRRFLWGAAGLVVLGALAVSLLWWRLQQGPIRIDFLESHIESALNDIVAPVSVELGVTTLEWVGGGRPVEILARDVRVLNPEGARLADFATVGVGLHLPALLHGKVLPTRLVFRRTHVVVKRAEDGRFELGLGDAVKSRDTDEPIQSFTRFLDGWTSPEDPDSPLAQLTEISIFDSRMEIHDRMMGVEWGAEKAEATLKRTAAALKADASWVLDTGEYRSEMSATAIYEASSEALRVDLRFKDLVPSPFAKSYPGLNILATLTDPITGSARVTLADATRLRAVEIGLDGVRGSIAANVSEITDDFSSLSGTLDAEGLKPWLFADLIPELKELARARLPVGGHVELDLEGGRVETLRFDIKTGKGTVSIPEIYAAPLSIEGIELEGVAEDHLANIDLSRIEAALPDVTLFGNVSAVRRGESYHGFVNAGIAAATITEVGKYWPEVAAGSARAWVVDHISVAAVSDIELDMSAVVTPGAPREDLKIDFGSFKTTFAFAGLTIDPLRPQPAVTDVRGTSVMTLDRLDFDVAGGRSQGIELDASKVAITNLSTEDPVGLSLDLAFSAPLESAAAVIADPPLKLVPSDLLVGLRGYATGGLKLEIPLGGGLDRHTVHTTANAKLRAFSWTGSPVPLGDRELTDGILDLNLDDDSLDVRGTVTVSGIPATVQYHENLTAGDPERRVIAHAVVNDAALEALDLPKQDYFSGEASLDVTYIGRRDGTSTVEAEVDLMDAVLEIPQVGWTKASGEGGHTSGVFELEDDGWTLDPFEIDAGGLKANGSLDLATAPTELRHLDLDRVRLQRSDFHAELTRDRTSGYRLRVEGPAFDAVPLIDYLKKVDVQKSKQHRTGEERDGEQPLPIDIGVHLDELWIAEDSPLSGVTAEFIYDGRWVDRLVVQAEMEPVAADHSQTEPGTKEESEPPQVSRLEVSHLPKDDGHELSFKTDNLGELIKGLHASTTVEGGTVVLSAVRPTPDAPFNGSLAVTDFTLVNLPALAKILELGSLRGISKGLTEEGLFFKKFTAKLDAVNGRITTTDGKALGHGFGITIRGTVDLKTNVVDLEGAVTPMETIQRIIGHLPLIGRLLAGWNREGVIAVLYDVKGPMEHPKFKVNGYSALTPGITREIHRLAPDDDNKDKPSGKKRSKKKKEKDSIDVD